MPVLTAPEAEESREHNLQSTEYTDNTGTLLHPTCRLQGLGLFCFFPRSCSRKGERTEGLENSGSERTSFDVS